MNESTDNPLLPDYYDDPSDILLSFPDIKAKTTQTLYLGGNIDKSPKGSVDEPIRNLVDLINKHPSFSTLSCCSGRISLFQPWARTTTTSMPDESDAGTENDMEEAFDRQDPSHKTTGTPGSGKGRGGWLLVSHEPTHHSKLLEIFRDIDHETVPSAQEKEKILMYKFEPLLLHVAAATHERGRQLLAVALERGFRESGLVIPSKRSNQRVTVAIRGMGLSLTVPLALRGDLRPSPEYLTALVDQSNQRMASNLAKLQSLFLAVEQTLFRPRIVDRVPWKWEPLPGLNLYGHDAVILPMRGLTADSSDVDVLVFGGYGQGPQSSDEKNDGKSHCQRLGSVHCLQRRGGEWATNWIHMPPPAASSSQMTIRMGSFSVDVKSATFTPREGAAVFLMDNMDRNQPIVGIWGGRRGPHLALDELLLYDHHRNQFAAPIDVRGELPECRWGHSLNSWNPKSVGDKSVQRLALLMGGRNEREGLNTAHILSVVPADAIDGSGHFLWEAINFDLPRPSLPFHHATVLIPDGDTEVVFVFGGHLNPCHLLEAFSSDERLEAPDRSTSNCGHVVSSFTLSMNPSHVWIARRCNMSISESLNHTFGVGGGIALMNGFANAEAEGRHLLLWTGGTNSDIGNRKDEDQNSSALQVIDLERIRPSESFETHWKLQSRSIGFAVGGSGLGGPEESVMVHHRAMALPPSRLPKNLEILLLAGGVMGFAFGPCFSRCYRLSIGDAHGKSIEGSPSPTLGMLGSSKAATTASKERPDAKTQPANVFYVRKQVAKLVKTELEKLSYLDKRFRMAPLATPDGAGKEIAIPITDACLAGFRHDNALESTNFASWGFLVEGIGRESMPFSTSQFAGKIKRQAQ